MAMGANLCPINKRQFLSPNSATLQPVCNSTRHLCDWHIDKTAVKSGAAADKAAQKRFTSMPG